MKVGPLFLVGIVALSGCKKSGTLPAMGTSTQRPTDPQLQSVASAVPADMHAPWNDAKADVASKAMKAKIGSKATFTLAVGAPKKKAGYGVNEDWEIASHDYAVRINGEEIGCVVFFRFNDAASDGADSRPFAAINDGDARTINGTVGWVHLEPSIPSVLIEMDHCAFAPDAQQKTRP